MQFNRSVGKNYTTIVHRGPEENTLEIEIKQKDVTASELNVHIIKFAEENLIDELDANTMQLVTEELVVMVLLPRMQDGVALQYFISYNSGLGTIKMGAGYPGTKYNPFEQEDNIFMINIFREWITDIQFSNPDNTFNELLLTMQAADNKSKDSELQSEAEKQTAAAGNKTSEKGKNSFDFTGGGDSIAAGAIASSVRKDEAHTLEVMIRDSAITSQKLFTYIDSFLENLELEQKTIVFDAIPTVLVGAIKSISKVLVFDVLEHRMNHFSYIAFKVSYIEGDGEITLRLSYPGNAYNPFVNNSEGKGIKVICRQTSIVPFFTYTDKLNEMIVLLELDK